MASARASCLRIAARQAVTLLSKPTDDREGRQTRGDRHLGLDLDDLDAVKGDGSNLGDHAPPRVAPIEVYERECGGASANRRAFASTTSAEVLKLMLGMPDHESAERADTAMKGSEPPP